MLKKVILLKEYNGNPKGATIDVSNNVAFGLIDSGIARLLNFDDCIKKIQFGKTKAVGKKLERNSYKIKRK